MAKKISELTAATAPLDGTEQLEAVQSAASRSVPVSDIRNHAINDQTASYTAVLLDAWKWIRMDVAGANDFTIPPESSVAFPVGTTLRIRQVGAGQTTVVAGAGVTINSPETLKLLKQHSSALAVKVAADEWDLSGELEAV